MWNGGMAQSMPMGGAPMGGGQQQQAQQKNDIFVGNLAFTTTEEQLHQAFSEIGRVIKVRLVTDIETGKPRGFAFIEFEDPQAALSAIRNMNDYELNGRRIRVNFSNSSHLEALAGKLGMDLSQQTKRTSAPATKNHQASTGTTAVADALKGMSKGELYDVVAKFKEIAERDPDEARRIMSGHPQLPEAMLFIMSKLDMVQTSVTADGGAAVLPGGALPGAPVPMPAARAADPRARAMDPRAASAAAPVDPRSAAAPAPPPPRADPRARVDPRAARSVPAPPPPQYGAPPPLPPQPPTAPSVANLNPALVQQVMSLTPQQISQLPPDKQQSILTLRQTISGGR